MFALVGVTLAVRGEGETAAAGGIEPLDPAGSGSATGPHAGTAGPHFLGDVPHAAVQGAAFRHVVAGGCVGRDLLGAATGQGEQGETQGRGEKKTGYRVHGTTSRKKEAVEGGLPLYTCKAERTSRKTWELSTRRHPPEPAGRGCSAAQLFLATHRQEW